MFRDALSYSTTLICESLHDREAHFIQNLSRTLVDEYLIEVPRICISLRLHGCRRLFITMFGYMRASLDQHRNCPVERAEHQNQVNLGANST